jgi:hypothetical protein
MTVADFGKSQTQHILPDLLGPRLKIVFDAAAAGEASTAVGAYHAGRGWAARYWAIVPWRALAEHIGTATA